MTRYQLDCEKACGYVEVDDDNIITDVMFIFSVFKGQSLGNLTRWVFKNFGYCTLKELK